MKTLSNGSAALSMRATSADTKERAVGFPTARLLRTNYLRLPVGERVRRPERQVVQRSVAHPVEERPLATRHFETPVTGEGEELRTARHHPVRVDGLRLELRVPHRHRVGAEVHRS